MVNHLFPTFALIFAFTLSNNVSARSLCDGKGQIESLSEMSLRIKWAGYLPTVRLSYSFEPRRLGPLADLSNAFQNRVFDKFRPVGGLRDVEDHIFSTLSNKHQVFVSLSFNFGRILFASDEVRVFRAARRAADKNRRLAHRFNAQKKTAVPDNLRALINDEYAIALANMICST